MKMSGEFSMTWKDERTNEHGIVESTNMIVNGGIDKLIDALLKETFQLPESGSILTRAVDYVSPSNVKSHIGSNQTRNIQYAAGSESNGSGGLNFQ